MPDEKCDQRGKSSKLSPGQAQLSGPTAAVGAPLLAFDGPEESGFRDLFERNEGLG